MAYCRILFECLCKTEVAIPAGTTDGRTTGRFLRTINKFREVRNCGRNRAKSLAGCLSPFLLEIIYLLFVACSISKNEQLFHASSRIIYNMPAVLARNPNIYHRCMYPVCIDCLKEYASRLYGTMGGFAADSSPP